MNQAFNVHAALRQRYGPPEWALLFEVGNATGFATNRHADAIAMSLWPSRGLDLHGIECKASRSDWIKELKDPAKAESIAQYCDFWWLAVADKAIVKDGELPATWGLLAPKGDKLVCVKEPVRNADKKPITRGFLAAMFRCIHAETALPEKEIRQKGYEEGYAVGKSGVDYHTNQQRIAFDELKTAVDEFQAKSGVRIHSYQGPNVAEQFNRCFVQPKRFQEELWGLLKAAGNIQASIRQAMATPTDEICDYFI